MHQAFKSSLIVRIVISLVVNHPRQHCNGNEQGRANAGATGISHQVGIGIGIDCGSNDAIANAMLVRRGC